MTGAGFSFCICPDGRLLREHVAAELAAQASAGGAWQRHVYWGDEELPAAFWEHMNLPGLLPARRALVIRRAHALPAAVWKRISGALASPKEHCRPFFCLEVAWEKGQAKIPAHVAKLKCLAYAESQGWVWRHAGLDERSLRAFVQREIKARKLRCEQGALDLLCAGLIPDASAVAAELDKLELAAPDGSVSAELAAQAAHVPAFDIFRFLRLMQGGRVQNAWTDVLRARRENEGLLFPLLGLLIREARLLWQLLQGEGVRAHPAELDAKRKLAFRLGYDGLTKLFSLLFLADLSVKSGERQPEQALDALVADVSLLLAATRSAHTPETLP
ncbi:MAG: DNA polymerase III subunit delta [Deltaproteobacteria bacterium]|jgi:DNA polymerase-3 subunit delta|nr:DNA polymerase III subunit delta [Deltaproteobacteria bacterium]